MEVKKIIIPEGWEIEKIENGEIILKETKKELPKTWEECYRLLDEKEYIDSCSHITFAVKDQPCRTSYNALPIGLGKPMLALCRLLVCREVYRQGWKPDYYGDEGYQYVIDVIYGHIDTSAHLHSQKVFSFQSAEIRDKFLKNFRDLIEEAKELI